MDWKLGGLGLAVLLLAGCDYQAKGWVRSALKDPDSAKFRDVRVLGHGETHTLACGYVNAKNSYGGYTGDQAFMIVDGRLYMDADAVGISYCCDELYSARKARKPSTLADSGFCSPGSIGTGAYLGTL